jgi:hypothetical protein
LPTRAGAGSFFNCAAGRRRQETTRSGKKRV